MQSDLPWSLSRPRGILTSADDRCERATWPIVHMNLRSWAAWICNYDSGRVNTEKLVRGDVHEPFHVAPLSPPRRRTGLAPEMLRRGMLRVPPIPAGLSRSIHTLSLENRKCIRAKIAQRAVLDFPRERYPPAIRPSVSSSGE